MKAKQILVMTENFPHCCVSEIEWTQPYLKLIAVLPTGPKRKLLLFFFNIHLLSFSLPFKAGKKLLVLWLIMKLGLKLTYVSS